MTRNYDFDFTREEGIDDLNDPPYRVSKPAYPDDALHNAVRMSFW